VITTHISLTVFPPKVMLYPEEVLSQASLHEEYQELKLRVAWVSSLEWDPESTGMCC